MPVPGPACHIDLIALAAESTSCMMTRISGDLAPGPSQPDHVTLAAAAFPGPGRRGPGWPASGSALAGAHRVACGSLFRGPLPACQCHWASASTGNLCIRIMCTGRPAGVTRHHTRKHLISTEELEAKLGIHDIRHYVHSGVLRYLGHVFRMDADRTPSLLQRCLGGGWQAA